MICNRFFITYFDEKNDEFVLQQQYQFAAKPINVIEGDQLHAQEQLRRSHITSVSASSTISATAPNEFSSLMDADLSFTALEFVLTLLASQSLLALKDMKLSQREKQLIKRELSTELSVFHELVKKRILWDGVRDEPLRRKKHGIQITTLDYDTTEDESDRHTPITNRHLANIISSSDRMRINLTRKLHLESQQSPSSSPVTTAGARSKQIDKYSPSSSTPAQQQQPMHELSDATFSELSFIRLVEEDYFHFLSNLFSYICHTEKIN